MSRLQCLGKSSTGSKKQLTVEVTSTPAEKSKPNDRVGKKVFLTFIYFLHPAGILLPVLSCSVQEKKKSGCPRGAVLNTDECSPKESISRTPWAEDQAQSTAAPEDELKMKALPEALPLDSAVTGGATHAAPASEPLPTYEANEERTEEEDVEDEELKAPVELIIEFLRAVMDGDFQLASKLCQMNNPEASEFLPLIQKKLSEEQEAEQSTEEEDEDDDDDDDDESGSDEESSQSSSCSSSSCSSSSSSDENEEEEKRANRHKPCPPSQICP
ncbi:glutamate-rich protein 2 isoform X2 [Sparus aurata]|uniref:glutamate-rich protein 2 isoform X2 n=1 Tax=Sparus aurata TaxID=8175 RepID=UPI0011C1CCEE|nr:nucleolin-like isoform X2 [Sparus aurata]